MVFLPELEGRNEPRLFLLDIAVENHYPGLGVRHAKRRLAHSKDAAEILNRDFP
jgi:hypothetical protein